MKFNAEKRPDQYFSGADTAPGYSDCPFVSFVVRPCRRLKFRNSTSVREFTARRGLRGCLSQSRFQVRPSPRAMCRATANRITSRVASNIPVILFREAGPSVLRLSGRIIGSRRSTWRQNPQRRHAQEAANVSDYRWRVRVRFSSRTIRKPIVPSSIRSNSENSAAFRERFLREKLRSEMYLGSRFILSREEEEKKKTKIEKEKDTATV